MPATFEPIATTTLGSAASTITFSSIPNTYTDLRLVLVGTSTVGGQQVQVQFNSDTGTNYSYTVLRGDGASATSTRATSASWIRCEVGGLSTTEPTFVAVDIFSYAGSTNKSVLCEGSGDRNGSGNVTRHVGLWRNTAAITTITLGASNFATGTTATLYGIKSA